MFDLWLYRWWYFTQTNSLYSHFQSRAPCGTAAREEGTISSQSFPETRTAFTSRSLTLWIWATTPLIIITFAFECGAVTLVYFMLLLSLWVSSSCGCWTKNVCVQGVWALCFISTRWREVHYSVSLNHSSRSWLQSQRETPWPPETPADFSFKRCPLKRTPQPRRLLRNRWVRRVPLKCVLPFWDKSKLFASFVYMLWHSLKMAKIVKLSFSFLATLNKNETTECRCSSILCHQVEHNGFYLKQEVITFFRGLMSKHLFNINSLF